MLGHSDVTRAKGDDTSPHMVVLRALTHSCPPGSYFHTLDWHEARDGRFQVQLPNVQPPSSGIYSATYLETSPLGSAFFRLIVRGQEQRAGVVGVVGA